MKTILISEICNEKPNSSALGALNEAYSQFIDIAKNSANGREFIDKARDIKNVPSQVADKFQKTYGKGDASMQQAAQRFVDKYNK